MMPSAIRRAFATRLQFQNSRPSSKTESLAANPASSATSASMSMSSRCRRVLARYPAERPDANQPPDRCHGARAARTRLRCRAMRAARVCVRRAWRPQRTVQTAYVPAQRAITTRVAHRSTKCAVPCRCRCRCRCPCEGAWRIGPAIARRYCGRTPFASMPLPRSMVRCRSDRRDRVTADRRARTDSHDFRGYQRRRRELVHDSRCRCAADCTLPVLQPLNQPCTTTGCRVSEPMSGRGPGRSRPGPTGLAGRPRSHLTRAAPRTDKNTR